MRHLLLTSMLLCSTTAYGASLDWSHVSVNADNMATFSLRYTSLPDFNYNQDGLMPNSFNIVVKDAGSMVSIIRGEYMPLGYGLPIFNPNDAMFTVGTWRGAVRYALNDTTLNFSAHLQLLGVTSPQSLTYRLETFENGAWAAQHAGCTSGSECYASNTTQAIITSTTSVPEPSFVPLLIGLVGVLFAWYRA